MTEDRFELPRGEDGYPPGVSTRDIEEAQSDGEYGEAATERWHKLSYEHRLECHAPEMRDLLYELLDVGYILEASEIGKRMRDLLRRVEGEE